MIGVYLSGTGNTKYCMEQLVSNVDTTAKCIPMEDKEVRSQIIKNDVIYLGYPTQFSNIPFMVRDFINKNKDIWQGKKVFCIATMGAFSGDGAGCSARLLKKYGAEILGGLHIHMPDSVCDSKMLKKSNDENRRIVQLAEDKIKKTANSIIKGKYPQNGLSFVSHIIGLLGQRLWFYGKTSGYTDKVKISDACIGCRQCVATCPMNNIELVNNIAVPNDRCTMCYRCVSICPKQAITILGTEVVKQYRLDNLREA